MEIPHSASLLDGLELCTSHVRSISTKPLTRAAELCDAVPKGACLSKFAAFVKIVLDFAGIFFRKSEVQKMNMKILNFNRILTELCSEYFEWFDPSPIEPFNLGADAGAHGRTDPRAHPSAEHGTDAGA